MEAIVPKIIEQGGLFALAVFAIWALNAVWKDRHATDMNRLEMERHDKMLLVDALKCNTEAITLMSSTVSELKRIVEAYARECAK